MMNQGGMKMTVEKIYFDMDGVLADFDRGVRELCGMEALDQGTRSPAQDDIMWEAIRKIDHFYDKLELMPGAKEMFDTLREKYGDKVEILTGIPREERGIIAPFTTTFSVVENGASSPRRRTSGTGRLVCCQTT